MLGHVFPVQRGQEDSESHEVRIEPPAQPGPSRRKMVRVRAFVNEKVAKQFFHFPRFTKNETRSAGLDGFILRLKVEETHGRRRRSQRARATTGPRSPRRGAAPPPPGPRSTGGTPGHTNS